MVRLRTILVVLIVLALASFACGTGMEGKYVRQDCPDDYIQLRNDGSFFSQETQPSFMFPLSGTKCGGRQVGLSGTYKVDRDQLILSLPDGQATLATIRGDVIIDKDGEQWVKGATTSTSRPTSARRTGSSNGYVAGIGVQQVLMPTHHVAEGVTVEYNTAPPTSGDHWGVVPGTPARCGFYEDGQPDERIVHNLEHGNIVISYNLASEEEVAELRDAVDSIGLSEIWGVTRFYDKIAVGTIAVAAWGVLDTMQGVDRDRIKRFYEAYGGNLGPERLVC